MILYTIGHSAHPINTFVNLLQLHQIQCLVDVRSVPASRWHPQYNKAALHKVLAEHQIGYIFAGQQLGGRPKDPTCYDPGVLEDKSIKQPRANFAILRERAWFKQGIADLVKQIAKGKTAILCSEEDPLRCHRHALIAKVLRDTHPEINVQHIRKNGALLSAEELFKANATHTPEQMRLL